MTATFLFQATASSSSSSLPAWVQAGAAVGALIVTGLLALITRRYVQITNAALNVSREQLASQQRVYAEFGLRNADEGERFEVWVVNLGTANFLLSEIHVRAASKSFPHVLKLNTTVLAGKKGKRFLLPDYYCEDDSWIHTRFLDISLSCVSSGEHKQTEWRPFSLVKEEGTNAWTIHRGFTGPLPVTCPECVEYTGLKMKSEKLENLDEAWKRRAEVENDLKSSHPKHKSVWLEPN